MTFRHLGCWVTTRLSWADTRASVGKTQLMAGTPFRTDVIGQDGFAHALDRTHNRGYALAISTIARIEASRHRTAASRSDNV
jgi:hypothetical protein